MHELIFYGRGGQGAVTAAKIMVAAALKNGFYAQAVPSFGQERKGAPVYAYGRIGREPITLHTFVYEPDCVVVFDWSLLELGVNVHQGAKPGGIFIVNAPALPPDLADLGYSKVGYVDAWGLTREHIGKVPPNAAMLGVLARTTGWFDLPALSAALQEAMPGEKGARNAACARAAYERTVVHEY